MTLNNEDLELFKKWLQTMLAEGQVTVTFTKKDGTEREMRCTTSPTLIMFKEPSILETTRTKAPSLEALPVYDLEKNAWKSFRWDSIKKVSITL